MSAELEFNKLDKIKLSSDQIKTLNWILTSKDVSNDFKHEAILKFKGTCSICNTEPSLYALFDGNNDGQVLERYCSDCFDKLDLR